VRRRPFLLLEVVIATLLVGLFAAVSIGSFLRAVRRQSALVQSVHTMRQTDLDRMHLIETYWYRLDELKAAPIRVTGASKTVFELSCQGSEKNHLLVIKEAKSNKPPYYYQIAQQTSAPS